jgi:hypothetical protein
MKYPNIPIDKPRGENQRIGTIRPADTVESSI